MHDLGAKTARNTPSSPTPAERAAAGTVPGWQGGQAEGSPRKLREGEDALRAQGKAVCDPNFQKAEPSPHSCCTQTICCVHCQQHVRD